METLVVIGDITVKADDEYVAVMVDDEIVLFMDRIAKHGLQDLVNTLQSVLKDK